MLGLAIILGVLCLLFFLYLIVQNEKRNQSTKEREKDDVTK